jgi:hypothetical protein
LKILVKENLCEARMKRFIFLSAASQRDDSIEISDLEGESTNEKWTIFLGYQGKFIMVLTSAVRLG